MDFCIIVSIDFGRKKIKNLEKSKFLGWIWDALGGVGGSFSKVFGGFSKNFEKSKIQKLKIE